MAVLRRCRREDVRYLRRSPAAKRHHIHSKHLLLLAHLQDVWLSFPSCSTFLTLATCYLSHLEVARATPFSPSPRNNPIALRTTCDPRQGLRRTADYVCQGENRCQFIEQYKSRKTMFPLVLTSLAYLIQFNEMLSRHSYSIMSRTLTLFSEICLSLNFH